MSAAAGAAGYLYAHDQLPRVESPERLEQKAVPSPDESESAKQPHTPRIEYRRRRLYSLPPAA
jgi:hypothetical protein